jgi:hypothetical protein
MPGCLEGGQAGVPVAEPLTFQQCLNLSLFGLADKSAVMLDPTPHLGR